MIIVFRNKSVRIYRDLYKINHLSVISMWHNVIHGQNSYVMCTKIPSLPGWSLH